MTIDGVQPVHTIVFNGVQNCIENFGHYCAVYCSVYKIDICLKLLKNIGVSKKMLLSNTDIY
jgi:hypothetical protein